MGSNGGHDGGGGGAWRVFWAWVEGATGNLVMALEGLVERVLSWTPAVVGGLGGGQSMDTLHTLLIGWLVFVVLILVIGSFFYFKFVKQLENDKVAQSAQLDVEPEGEADEGVATQRYSKYAGRGPPGGGGGGGGVRQRQPAAAAAVVVEPARKPTIVPDGPREPVSPPVATGADPDAVNWANNVFTWFYNSVDGGPIITKKWLETVSENTVKTALETGILVEVVEVYKVTPAPVLSNMVVDCSPNDNITITCDCDALVYLRLITTRTQGDLTTESEYACVVSPLRGRLNIASLTEQLIAVVKFDGWPEVEIQLEGIRNNATGLHEQSIIDVISEVVTSAVRNSVLDLNFQDVSTFPRFRRARQAPDKIIPVGYDSMVRELQTHPPSVPKTPSDSPIAEHHEEQLEEAGESFTAISFAPTLSRQGVLTTSEEQLIVRNLNKYPSLENTELEGDDMSEWQKTWEENYVPAAEVPVEEPESMEIATIPNEIEEPKEEALTQNFVLVASNRSKLIDEPRSQLTIEEVIEDEEPVPSVKPAADEPCIRTNNATRDSILATPVVEPPKRLEDEEEDLDQPLRLDDMNFVDTSVTGTSGFGPIPALPGLQKGPFVSEACSVGIGVSITTESCELEASVQTASFEPSVACDLSECDQEVPIPFYTLSQSPSHNQSSDDLIVCPFSDSANSPDDCHVNLPPSYASTSSFELETYHASALHAVEGDRSRENSPSLSNLENSFRSFGEGSGISQNFILPENSALVEACSGENEVNELGNEASDYVYRNLPNRSQERLTSLICSGKEHTGNILLNCCPKDSLKFIDDSESDSPYEGECRERALSYMFSSEEQEEEIILKSDLTEELNLNISEKTKNKLTGKKICLNEFTDTLFRCLELEESELSLPEENIENLTWEIAGVYEANNISPIFSQDDEERESEDTLSDLEDISSSDDKPETRSSLYKQELSDKSGNESSEYKQDLSEKSESESSEYKQELSNKSENESLEDKQEMIDKPLHYALGDESAVARVTRYSLEEKFLNMSKYAEELDTLQDFTRFPVSIRENEEFHGSDSKDLKIDCFSMEHYEQTSDNIIKSDTSEYEEEDSVPESYNDSMSKLSELSDTLAETDDEDEDTLYESNQNNTRQAFNVSITDYVEPKDFIEYSIENSLKTNSSSVPFASVMTEIMTSLERSSSEEELDFVNLIDPVKKVKESYGDSAVVEDLFPVGEAQMVPQSFTLDSNLGVGILPPANICGFQNAKSKFLMGMLSTENLTVDPVTFFGYKDDCGLSKEEFSITCPDDLSCNTDGHELDDQSVISSNLSNAMIGSSTDSEVVELEGSLHEEQDIIFSDETNHPYDHHNWRDTDIEEIAEVVSPRHSEGHNEFPMSYTEAPHLSHNVYPDTDRAVKRESVILCKDEGGVEEKQEMTWSICQVTETSPDMDAGCLSQAKLLLSSEDLPCTSVYDGKEVFDKSLESDGRNEVSNNILEFSGDRVLTTESFNVDALTELDTSCALTHQQGRYPFSWNQYSARDESASDSSSLASGWPQWSRPLSSYPVYGTYYVVRPTHFYRW